MSHEVSLLKSIFLCTNNTSIHIKNKKPHREIEKIYNKIIRIPMDRNIGMVINLFIGLLK